VSRDVRKLAAEAASKSNRRAEWMRQIRRWHWISGAISLGSMLLFSITGITLNRSALFESKPNVITKEATLEEETLSALVSVPRAGRAPVPASLASTIRSTLGVDVTGRDAEWSKSDIYIALPRPGGDAWLSIDRQDGAMIYERTDRGWISYLNDLHKGRHTGPVWGLFIDVFAIASIIFCITGLLLLQLYAKGRSMTWPLVGFGVGLPLLLGLFLIH
jgi:hypothetical protein